MSPHNSKEPVATDSLAVISTIPLRNMPDAACSIRKPQLVYVASRSTRSKPGRVEETPVEATHALVPFGIERPGRTIA